MTLLIQQRLPSMYVMSQLPVNLPAPSLVGPVRDRAAPVEVTGELAAAVEQRPDAHHVIGGDCSIFFVNHRSVPPTYNKPVPGAPGPHRASFPTPSWSRQRGLSMAVLMTRAISGVAKTMTRSLPSYMA
jgi:hypothetical protein